MPDYPTSPRQATDLIKGVLRHLDGVTGVNTRQATNCLHSVVHLAEGDADAMAILTYLRAAFADCEVTGFLRSRFISIAFRAPGVADHTLDEAYAMNDADIYTAVIRDVAIPELAAGLRESVDGYRVESKLTALGRATVKAVGRREVYVRVPGFDGLATSAVDRAFCALEGSPYDMPLEQGLITPVDGSAVRFTW